MHSVSLELKKKVFGYTLLLQFERSRPNTFWGDVPILCPYSYIMPNAMPKCPEPKCPSAHLIVIGSPSEIMSIYSYTFKSVILESVKIKIFSNSLKMVQIIISENSWKWHFWKCHSWKCQTRKCSNYYLLIRLNSDIITSEFSLL